MDDETGDGGFAGDPGRRDALKKIGIGAAGAAAVWSAPNILSVTAAAAATGGGGGGSCPGCGLENIVNGSFEDPADPSGGNFPAASWATVDNAFATTYADHVAFTPPPGAGDQTGALLNPSAAFSQTFPVDQQCWGKPYSFSFWATSFFADSTGQLAFGGTDGSSDVTVVVPVSPDGIYAQYQSPPATIPTGTTSVTVTLIGGARAFVDLVSFVIGC